MHPPTFQRVHLIADMEDIVVFKASDNMENYAHLSNRAQELISKTFSFVGSLDQSGDVNELHLVVHNLLRMTNGCQLVEFGIWNRHK